MESNYIKKLFTIFFICLMSTVDVIDLQAQGSSNDRLIRTIISNRQKIFNRKKNPNISCEEMKNRLIAIFSKSDNSIKDLDPLDDVQIRKFLKCPQTKWESVLERSQVELYKDQVIRGMEELAIPMPKNIAWAPTQCPCYNAVAKYLGANLAPLREHWLIEVNSSLDISTGEYAKVAALATPVTVENNTVSITTNLDSYEDRLNNNPDIFKAFMMRLLAHLVNDPAIDEESIRIGSPHLPLYAMYSQYAQIFALSHELSHVLLDHRAVEKGLVVSIGKDEARISYTSFAEGNTDEVAHKQEYEADSLGLEIMLAVANANYDRPPDGGLSDLKIKMFGIYGADMLLTWMEMFQNAEVITYGNYTGYESHPPASERRNRVRRIMTKKGLITENQDFGLSTYRAMYMMWDKFETKLAGSMAQKIRSMKKPERCRSND